MAHMDLSLFEAVPDAWSCSSEGVAVDASGLRVRHEYTITTEACDSYDNKQARIPEGLWDQVLEWMKDIEQQAGKKFSDPSNPLLVRSARGRSSGCPGHG